MRGPLTPYLYKVIESSNIGAAGDTISFTSFDYRTILIRFSWKVAFTNVLVSTCQTCCSTVVKILIAIGACLLIVLGFVMILGVKKIMSWYKSCVGERESSTEMDDVTGTGTDDLLKRVRRRLLEEMVPQGGPSEDAVSTGFEGHRKRSTKANAAPKGPSSGLFKTWSTTVLEAQARANDELYSRFR